MASTILPIPPGEHLREELEARGWMQQDLADILGRPLQAVNEILQAKKAITHEMAILLGQALGTGPEVWLNLEQRYRLELAKAKQQDELVEQKSALFSAAPVRELVKRQWLEVSIKAKNLMSAKEVDSLRKAILQFFDVKNLTDIEAKPLFGNFKTSCDDISVVPAIRAWLQRAMNCAQEITGVKRYDLAALKSNLDTLVQLSREGEQGIKDACDLLLSVGVRVVFVPHLQHTKIDGAAFWISEKEPVIAISLRFARVDNFWFTLFHEIGHILLHGYQSKGTVDESILEQSHKSDKKEIEADKFAQNSLIDEKELRDFVKTADLNKINIRMFAKSLKIHPAIVVGRLQHDKQLDFRIHTSLLEKIERSEFLINEVARGAR